MNQEEGRNRRQNLFVKSIVTGIAGAFLWGIIGSIAYLFSFSQVSHATFTLRSFFSGSWTEGLTGELISLVIISILGIIPALIYYFLFKKFARVIHGVIYGLVWWVLLFVLLNPWFSYVPAFDQLSRDTLAATICLFALYGVFVSYTIAFDANDERITFQDQGN